MSPLPSYGVTTLKAASPAVSAAAGGGVLPEPYIYDLVNTAREVLAQLSTPMLLNFSASFNGTGTVLARCAMNSAIKPKSRVIQ
jgi:hypothetical protein